MTESVIIRENARSECGFKNLEEVYEKAKQCSLCPLSATRNNVVLFRGNSKADLMIIGEGPGYYEDQSGLPFVGKAGQLLDRILASVNLDKDKDVYICNVVKCRPPGNRVPTELEMDKCESFLDAQIKFVQPKIILLAGGTAMNSVLKANYRITKMRGKWLEHENGAKVMPVFHPSYLLRNDSRVAGSPKWLMWQDIKEVRKELDKITRKQPERS